MTCRDVQGGRSNGAKSLSVAQRNPSAHALSLGDLILSVDDQGAIPSGFLLVEAASVDRRRTMEGEKSSIVCELSDEKRSCVSGLWLGTANQCVIKTLFIRHGVLTAAHMYVSALLLTLHGSYLGWSTPLLRYCNGCIETIYCQF